jgi:membrane protein required for colicin V production
MLEQFNILDWIFLAITLFFVLRGLMRGLLGELGSLLALALAVAGGFMFYHRLAGFLRRVVGKADFWWETAAFIICFLVIYYLVTLLAARISQVLYHGKVSVPGRLLGIAPGLIKALVFCYLIINILHMTQFETGWLATSALSPRIVESGHYLLQFIPNDFLSQLQSSGFYQHLPAVPGN